MVAMVIDVDPLARFGDRCAAAAPKLQAATLRGVDKGGKYVEGVAKGNAPHKSGHLRRSILSQATPMGAGAQAIVRPSASYAEAVEKGRKAFGPVTKKALRFTVGGKVVFAKHVKATEGQWYMKRAYESSRGPVIRIVEHEVATAIEGIV